MEGKQIAILFGYLCYLALCGAELPVTQIIQGYGYPCEEHVATTSDGWNLAMQRIPHGKNKYVSNGSKGVVLFQHGLMDTSAGVCLNTPGEALPFILADAGYDVWFGNNRGNGYSMSNNNFNSNQAEFWDFSWDEMASIDFPTQIQYVLTTTGASKLSYIGHSEGTIQAFAGLVRNNDIANSLNIYIALAPVATVGYQRAILLEILAKLHTDDILSYFGLKEFALSAAIQKLLPNVCKDFPSICNFQLAAIMGPSANLNQTRLPYYMTYEPNPTSVKNMIHWSQGVRTDLFQMYDYGSTGNMQHYNQSTPPQYNLQNFPQNLPVALFTGGEDYLADPTDVSWLISQLPNSPMVHTEPTYSHIDFLWNVDAHNTIYPRILTLLAKYSQ